MTPELYRRPMDYLALFGPPDAEELAFYRGIIPAGGRVLSLGCGAGRIEAPLAAEGTRFVGIDASAELAREAARRDRNGQYVAGLLEENAISFSTKFAAVISSLLSFAYVADRAAAQRVLAEAAAMLEPDGPMILDLPVSEAPRRLQGVRETFRGEVAGRGVEYAFHYDDLERDEGAFAVLHTRIEGIVDGTPVSRRAPLAVYRPEGVREMMAATGMLGEVTFYAPHDLASGCASPPPGAYRAIAVSRRVASPCV